MTAQDYLQAGLAFVLQVLVLQALVRHGGRQYILLTLLICSQFLGTVLGVAIGMSISTTWIDTAQLYWTSEIVQAPLFYATIIGFIYGKLGSSNATARLGRWLIGFSLIGAALSLWIHHDERLNLWMSSVTRNLTFIATILNLILWGILLRNRERDRLLLVSGGLGVQFAGYALGQALRVLWERSSTLIWIGNRVIVLSYLISLLILYKAFRNAQFPPPDSAKKVR
jgi:hypothetical protein